MDKVNLQIVRESFGRVVYSHKTHEKECEILEGRAGMEKWVNVALTALTFGGIVSNIFIDQASIKVITAIIATTTLGFTIYQLSFSPEKLAAKHRIVAKELWYIREKYVSLIADILSKSLSKEQIQKRRDDLIDQLGTIYKFAPQTSSEAYKKAQKALKISEEMTFSDKEIDQFLPKELKLQKK